MVKTPSPNESHAYSNRPSILVQTIRYPGAMLYTHEINHQGPPKKKFFALTTSWLRTPAAGPVGPNCADRAAGPCSTVVYITAAGPVVYMLYIL